MIFHLPEGIINLNRDNKLGALYVEDGIVLMALWYDENRVYLLNIHVTTIDIVRDIIVPGAVLEDEIQRYTCLYPTYNKIVVYDAETKDAVRIIRNSQ